MYATSLYLKTFIKTLRKLLLLMHNEFVDKRYQGRAHLSIDGFTKEGPNYCAVTCIQDILDFYTRSSALHALRAAVVLIHIYVYELIKTVLYL